MQADLQLYIHQEHNPEVAIGSHVQMKVDQWYLRFRKEALSWKKKTNKNYVVYCWTVFCCPNLACSKLTKKRVAHLKNVFPNNTYLPLLTMIIAVEFFHI